MGFERHAIPSIATPAEANKRDSSLPREAPVVTPLRPADVSRETDTLRVARQMRGEWRKQRYSRLADH
jgi:hypothetical protein